MTSHTHRCLAIVCFAVLARPAVAQQPPAVASAAAPDTITRIFSGEFNVRLPNAPHWFDEGAAYLVTEGADIVRYDTATGRNREVLISAKQLTPPGAAQPIEVAGLDWSRDGRRVLVFTNTQKVWRTNSRGDYWLLDRQAGSLKKLGGSAPPASLMYAAFNPDATQVAYVRDNDIYVEDLATGGVSRLTQDGSDLVINGGSDWVNEEELDLHDCFRWSPDGKRIVFWQFDLHGVGDFSLQYYLGQEKTIVTQIPYPSSGPYPINVRVPYPLAGTTNSAVRVGVVPAAGGPVTWLAIPGDTREHYVGRVQWADAGTVLIQQLNRLENTELYFLASADDGAARRIWENRDSAFVTIGFGGLPEARLIRGGAEFLALSERDGWMHVYRVTREGRDTLVTRGDMDVASVVGVDEHAGQIYFIASPENATQRFLYRAALDGSSPPVRVTPANFAGTNSYSMAADGKHAFHAFSTFDNPGLRELITLPEHTVTRVLGNATAATPGLASFLASTSEFFKADAGGGVQVDGYIVRPPRFDPSKKYPVLVFIYGEPAGQTVADSWGSSAGLYHRYLASLGYLVVSFDNAGTPAPRGRAWRKAIYGEVGVLSSEQQAAALRSLAAMRSFVDLDRVAVWGWSGGGTNTLNLMFRHPELYRVGMAVAPVPDQRLYDSIYQERYMGLPQVNTDGYRRASAINLADRLAGDLLIVHGSGDDNVHYQGSQLLVNRLIELGKPFDFMTYPDRTHAISEGPGTTAHLYHLLTRYLTTHLPAGPR
jgi:dipeptidyl-peptidase-4